MRHQRLWKLNRAVYGHGDRARRPRTHDPSNHPAQSEALGERKSSCTGHVLDEDRGPRRGRKRACRRCGRAKMPAASYIHAGRPAPAPRFDPNLTRRRGRAQADQGPRATTKSRHPSEARPPIPGANPPQPHAGPGANPFFGVRPRPSLGGGRTGRCIFGRIPLFRSIRSQSVTDPPIADGNGLSFDLGENTQAGMGRVDTALKNCAARAHSHADGGPNSAPGIHRRQTCRPLLQK